MYGKHCTFHIRVTFPFERSIWRLLLKLLMEIYFQVRKKYINEIEKHIKLLTRETCYLILTVKTDCNV